MERIDTQQTSKKTIPAICEAEVRTESGHSTTGTSATNWLSSAMAIWLRDDDVPKRNLRTDKGPNHPIR
ncbi:MAG: hypothetical protein EPO09_12395 [Aquabacterium sp.]|uniref:hypothetical protein n=1 Tax=Aquabacterium sp. TaxID=1872578 RepID=UPI0011FA4D09|nr:hypothetical protein [Aquabacterium sp.]TAK93522.1 MAG: hypothetical protein EPO09_12395 [Aquabacterium sp.]